MKPHLHRHYPKMRIHFLTFTLLVFTSIQQQVAGMCEMGDLWLIRQFEPTNAQYWANWLNVCPSQKLPCNGEIIEWTFFSTSDDGSPIFLSVWRQIEPTGFQLIGFNAVNATKIGVLRFQIDKEDRIRAKAGDVFGVFYEHRDSAGSVGFIAGVGSSSNTMGNHVLHSCISQQLTKDEILQYMEANGRVAIKGQASSKLFMVQAVVHDENEIVRAKTTEKPVVSCGPIPQIQNAVISNYQPAGARVNGLLGDTIDFECRETYRIVGPGRVRCQADMKWSAVPRCEPTVFCGAPPLITHAHSTPSLSRADTGTVIRYACEPGYAFSVANNGNFSMIVCQDNGTWSTPPVCDRVESSCGPPPTVSFAVAIPLYDSDGKSAVFGDAVRYKCDMGYFLMGNDTIMCGRDGRWSDLLPRCGGMYRLCDNKLPEVENAQVVYSSTEPFSVAFYICRQGYIGEGNRAHIRCLPDGSWEKPDYICNRKLQHVRGGTKQSAQQVMGVAQCKNPPPQVENAIVIVRSTEPGAPATYLCLEDHRPLGNSTVVCGDDGVWRGDPEFACVQQMTTQTRTTTTTTFSPLTCGNPPQIAHATGWQLWRGRPSQVGDIVKYLCAEQYTLTGNITVMCQPNGKWSDLPTCNLAEPDCDWPPEIPHAVLVSNVDGIEASYECQDGYTKVGGGSTIMCRDNQWSKPLFTCNPLNCGDPPIVRNADWVPKGVASPGTVVIYECQSGTRMVGGDSIVCQTTGTWTTPPDCIEVISCGPPPLISNSIIVNMVGLVTMGGPGNLSNDGSISSPGSSVTYGCANGFRLTQNRSTTYCQNDRKWSEPLPSCEATLYKSDYLGAFWPLSKRYGVRDISGHSYHGAAPILLNFQPATGRNAPMASIAEFGPNRYVEIRHYRDQFNYAAKSFSYVMYLGPSTIDGPILEYDSVGGRLGFHIWIQAAQMYVYYEPKYFLYSGFTGNEIKTPKIDLRKWNFLASVYDFKTGMASIWLDDQKLAEKQVGHLYPEMSQGFYIGQHKRPTGDPRQFQGQQIACVGAYKIALDATDLTELKKMCLRLLASDDHPGPQTTPRPPPMTTNRTHPVCHTCQHNKDNTKINQEMPVGMLSGSAQPPLMARDAANANNKLGLINASMTVTSPTSMDVEWSPPIPNVSTRHETTTLTMPEFPAIVPHAKAAPSQTTQRAPSAGQTTDALGPSCGRVPYVSNAMVSDGFSNGSSHVGDTATYRCFTGYQLVGEPTIHCHANGEWTIPPRCIDKLGGESSLYPMTQCQEAPAVRNGDILFTNRSIGGVTLYRCQHGFALSGSAISFCQSDGKWSDLPDCKQVDCGKAPVINNGDVRYDSTLFGSQAFYTCNAGYQLQGFQIATCTETGVWFQIPVCHGSSCQPPSQIANANMIPLRGDGRQPGSIFKVSCKPNYRLVDHANDTMTCLPDGQWTKPPACVEIECGGLPVIANGIIRPPALPTEGPELTRAQVRTVAVTCQTGFRLKGPATLTCNGDGTWSTPPTCEQFSCDPPPQVDNAIYANDTVLPGSVVVYNCIPGFRLTGNVEIRCSADGRWIGQPPVCRETHCHPPALHPGTAFSYSNDRLIAGTTLVFNCYNGSYLEGNNTGVCLENGQWTKMGRCLPVTCGLPPSVNNSFIVRLDGYNFSNSVVYSCKEGFSMVGTATLTCTSKGHWTEAPRCEPPPCPTPNPIDNGSVNFNTPVNPGTHAAYSCSPGYELVGSRNLTCLNNGQWNDSFPICRALSCGNPPEIPNSMVTIFCNSEVCSVGEKAIYECPPQWHLAGSAVVTCLPDRKWSHIPSCIAAKNAPRENEGRMIGVKRSRLSRLSSSSGRNTGRQSAAASSSRSGEIPRLTGPTDSPVPSMPSFLETGPTVASFSLPPFLQPTSMPDPDEERWTAVEEFGQRNFEDVERSSGASHFPPSNYNGETYNNPFTEEMLPWEELSTPSTDLITCGQAPFVPNSLVSFSFVGEGSRPGDTARYACSGNFQMRGPDVVVCLDSGHWSVVPACESPCPMLTLQNGYVTYYNHSVQTVVTETETNDEALQGKTSHSSMVNSVYHDEVEPSKQPDFADTLTRFTEEKSPAVGETSTTAEGALERVKRSGGPAGLLQFEFRYTSSVHEGTVARFGCESSYDIVGPREAVCQKDGSWSAPVPKCSACHQMSIGNVPSAIVLNEVAYMMSPNTTLFIDMRFNCSGRLTSWVYYCRSREADQAAGAYLGVWRPVISSRAPPVSSRRKEMQVNEFKLVGKTFVKPRQYGFNVHNLTDREAIDVKFGDVIGFHYAVPAIPARYLTIPVATQRDPWPFDAHTLSRTYSQALTDRDIVRDDNIVRMKSEHLLLDRQIPAIKAVLSPANMKRKK